MGRIPVEQSGKHCVFRTAFEALDKAIYRCLVELVGEAVRITCGHVERHSSTNLRLEFVHLE